MSERGFVNRKRDSEYISAKIFGNERIKRVRNYCKEKNINLRSFLEELIDNFFLNKKNELMTLSKEELVEMIMRKGDAQ